ncbi:MFS transporter [Hahella sp. SMD15-11]|uniref:MFS transporter n=1 Tax=Thermohahella caldifontis TaxID=3142973 RepID=A0AB39UZH4_9GAMM
MQPFPLSVVMGAIAGYMALYAPQPLLPWLAARYDLSPAMPGLLVSIVLAGLAVAPLVLGRLTRALSPTLILRVVWLALALSCVWLALDLGWAGWVSGRILQALLLPVLFSVSMARVSALAPAALRPGWMATFVAATILGGFLGRAVMGAAFTLSDWRYFYVGLAALLVLLACNPRGLHDHCPAASQEVGFDLVSVRRMLSRPRQRYPLMAVMIAFFCFQAVLNVLPFRVREISPGSSELLIGLMYGGYALGLVASLVAPVSVRYPGLYRWRYTAGMLVYGCALTGLMVPSLGVIFLALALVCIAMFWVHSHAMADFTARIREARLSSAVYVSGYYVAGTVGSVAPGWVYAHSGWRMMLLVLLTILVLAAVTLGIWEWGRLRREDGRRHPV